MKTRCLDHIDLRVKDMEVARKFYGKFLPQLGFVRERHEPSPTRIAFWADTRGEVDRIAKLVRDAGGKNLEGPEICRSYSPGYYAFFFEDPDGNKLEICCRESPVIAQ